MGIFPTLWSPTELRSPFRAMSRMQREVDRMFDDILTGDWASESTSAQDDVFQPLCDVQEASSHYLLSFDLPGLSKNDVKIELQDNSLRVFGERKDERQVGRGVNSRTERAYGAFERIISLPANAKPEAIEAQFENGVLHVAVPKTEAAKARQIQISEGRPGAIAKLLGKKEEKAA